MSLHALQDLGYECSHMFLAGGNLLKIWQDNVEYSIQLTTWKRQDFVLVRVVTPEVEPERRVSALDLKNHVKDDALYHLMHLRWGCPGKETMKRIIAMDGVTGVPKNITIPEFFKCPICDKEKTQSVPANPMTDRFLLPKGARFQADFGF